MRAGRVKSDKHAFRQVLGRLENEVGTLIRLIEEAKKGSRYFKNTAPFWSLTRILFPIAESLGDLIYRNVSPVKNLTSVLGTEFETERSGYKGKEATLALLYRHSLTHQDEVRSVVAPTRECRWRLSYDERADHLQVVRKTRRVVGIQFDTTAFYDDVVSVCRTAMRKRWGGEVKKRYNGWLILDLRPPKSLKPNEQAAVTEIGAL
jgi:hypothetical protein